MNIYHKFIVIFFLLTGWVYAGPNRLLSELSAIKLGMTIKEASRLLKPAILKKEMDGEGVPLYVINKDGKLSLTLFAGFHPAQSSPITRIEIWDPTFKTAKGVAPGMLIEEVEKKYGRLKAITRSEIEAQEYAVFAHQPKNLLIRVSAPQGKPAGYYTRKQDKTTAYTKNAHVVSLIFIK